MPKPRGLERTEWCLEEKPPFLLGSDWPVVWKDWHCIMFAQMMTGFFFHAKQKLEGDTFFGSDFYLILLKLLNDQINVFHCRRSSSAVTRICNGTHCAHKYSDTVPLSTLRN